MDTYASRCHFCFTIFLPFRTTNEKNKWHHQTSEAKLVYKHVYQICLLLSKLDLIPRWADARRHLRRAGGVETPILTQFLWHLEENGKKWSKARQNTFWNYFGSLLLSPVLRSPEVTEGEIFTYLLRVSETLYQKPPIIPNTMIARKNGKVIGKTIFGKFFKSPIAELSSDLSWG